MKLSNMFSPVKSMTEDEAKTFMNSRKAESYQLVDVRQPEEYEEEHLPGAMLLPLNVLTAGGGDLDPTKPTIVYCRSGGRSQAGSQWLANHGYGEIYDIGSNIRSWLGTKAVGSYDLNLDLIKPEAEFPDAWSMAYAMEEGLQLFYLALEKWENRAEYKKLCEKLAGFEKKHKERLMKGYSMDPQHKGNPALFLKEHRDLIEGGDLNRKSPMNILDSLQDIMDIFSLSMAIETQSLDLYVRLANNSTNPESKKLFMDLADEEKVHLSYLSKEMDSYLIRQKSA